MNNQGIFGFQNDNDAMLVSNGGGFAKFGLNTGMLTKVEFNPNGGKNDTPADCVDVEVDINGSIFKRRIYDVTGDLFKGNDRISPDQPEYNTLYEREMKQRLATIIHIIKSTGVTDQILEQVIANKKPNDFKSWCNAVLSTINGRIPAQIDVFMEYQWSIKSGQNRTFLQLPGNMKGGSWIIPHADGNFKEVRDDEGMHYEDEKGNRHPFKRNPNFMTSNKANAQIAMNTQDTMSPFDIESAEKSSW